MKFHSFPRAESTGSKSRWFRSSAGTRRSDAPDTELMVLSLTLIVHPPPPPPPTLREISATINLLTTKIFPNAMLISARYRPMSIRSVDICFHPVQIAAKVCTWLYQKWSTSFEISKHLYALMAIFNKKLLNALTFQSYTYFFFLLKIRINKIAINSIQNKNLLPSCLQMHTYKYIYLHTLGVICFERI